MKTKTYLIYSLILLTTLAVRASQITNSVNITTNLTFYLKSLGPGEGPQSRFKSNELIYRMLIGTTTNLVCYRVLPKEQIYEFHLFDKMGKEVQKTKTGMLNSAPALPPSKKQIDGYKASLVSNESGDYFQLFRPDEMFAITNKGDYEMEVRMRLCVPMTNGLPDSAVMLKSQRFFSAQNLGIVTSPPIRVKVVNE